LIGSDTPRAIGPTIAWTVIGEWTPRLVGFGITLYVARRLQPHDFGIYALALAWVHLCWGAVDVGTSNYALRLLAEEPKRREQIFSELVGLNVCLSVIAAGIGAGLTILIVKDPVTRASLLLMLIFLLAFALYPDWYLRGTTDLPVLAVGNFASTALWLGLIATLGPVPQPMGFALAWSLSPLAGAAVFWGRHPRLLRLDQALSPRRWLVHLRISSLFAVSGGLSNATIPAASTALRLIGGNVILGSYAVGQRIASVFAGALLIALQNLTPFLVRQRGRIRHGWFVGLALLCGSALFGGAILLIPFTLIPLIGQAYAANIPIILIGLAAIVPWSAKLPIEVLLIARHSDRARIEMQLASLVVVAVATAIAAVLQAWPVVAVGYVVGEAIASLMGWLRLNVVDDGLRRETTI
jgi:O-antigen/teichoic acid export membrane protein